MNVKVYNQTGKETGTAELPDSVFAYPWNSDLVYQVATSQEANKRQIVAHTKGRSEVRGGGRKPWRQKGTGRARHGSIRSPLWKGGGVTHGPSKFKNFKKKINKKMAISAMAAILSAKLKDQEIVFLESLNISTPKTKEAVGIVKNISKISGYSGVSSKSSLLLLPEHSAELFRAFRNISNIDIGEARSTNALELLNHKYIIVPKESILVFEKRVKSK